MMKRLLLLQLLILFCFSGCLVPASETAQTQAPPPSVIAMSSPEFRTSDRDPVASGASMEPSLTEPAPSTEPAPAVKPAPTDPALSSEPDPAEPGGMYLLVNGIRLAPGMNYAEVKASLDAQTAPDQALSACDGSCFGTIHFYPGMTVTEDENGVIRGIELNLQFEGETDAALLGKVGLGETEAAVLNALGVPENAMSVDVDCVLIYRQEGLDVSVCFFDADSPDTVSSIQLTAHPE